jgi:TolA-binding protein
MNDPTRLIDEAGGDELEGSLLRLARQEGPSAEGRRKILAAVAAASAASLASSSAHAAATAGKSLTLAKWGALAVAALALPAAVLLLRSGDAGDRKVPRSSVTAPATVVALTPLAPPPVAEKGPRPIALKDLPALPAAPTSQPFGRGSRQPQASLADEVAQLQDAKLALKSGNPQQALAELNTYARRFPRPALGAEATVLRIEALRQMGDVARAKALAESFLAKHPSSPYAARLRSLTGAR